jgi:ATP-binding cassette subfamily C protein
VIARIYRSDEWKFFGVLPRAQMTLAVLWWALIVLRGVLPVVFAITIGVLVTAVKNGDSLAMPLTVSGAVFIVLQMLTPLHVAVSANVGSKTSAWLNDRLTTACVGPPGMAHWSARADRRSDDGAT